MNYTFVFGAQVRNGDTNLGRLERIIVNNGIANQITVNPGLLQTERVVPISDIQSATADEINLNISDDDWKAYTAYRLQQSLGNPNEAQPNLAVLAPTPQFTQQAPDTSHPTSTTGARANETSVDLMSVVLTASTTVSDADRGGQARLKGLVVDTGRPQLLLLDDESNVSYDAVSRLDEQQILLGGTPQQPLLDADRGYESTTAHDPSGDQRR